MNAFITNFGIDWKLLLSQLVGFVVLFILLKALAFKPILAILKKRQGKIEKGLDMAQEAETRLKEVDNISRGKLKEADAQSSALLKKTEQQAKLKEDELLKIAHEKEEDILVKADLQAMAKQEEAREKIKKEAVAIVKELLVKTVEMAPGAIDDKLMEKAVKLLK
ncbi:MAG: hypothetical protein AAB620_01340 [Patescibacteria group bacterium]